MRPHPSFRAWDCVCGERNPSQISFCAKCGRHLSAGTAVVRRPDLRLLERTSRPEPPDVTMPQRLLALAQVGAIVALVAGIVVWSFGREWAYERWSEFRGEPIVSERVAAVARGMTAQEVRTAAGKPESIQSSGPEGLVGPSGLPLKRTEYWYYDGGKTELVLEDGRVVAINNR